MVSNQALIVGTVCMICVMSMIDGGTIVDNTEPGLIFGKGDDRGDADKMNRHGLGEDGSNVGDA